MADPIPTGSGPDVPPATPQPDGRLVLTPALRVPGGPASVPEGPGEAGDEALREAVRAILKDELEGEFGARITREVRKLVRAEVRTLLAARDPD